MEGGNWEGKGGEERKGESLIQEKFPQYTGKYLWECGGNQKSFPQGNEISPEPGPKGLS